MKILRVILTRGLDGAAYRARVFPSNANVKRVGWSGMLAWGAGKTELEAVGRLNDRLAILRADARATVGCARRVDSDVFYLFHPPSGVH